MSKSYVSMEQKVCVVCGIAYDSGAILMDTRLRNSMEVKTTTGWGLCDEHQKLMDEGYIALVEATGTEGSSTLKQENAIRTGNIYHLRRAVAHNIFNVKLPDDLPMVFIEPGVIEKIQAMQAPEPI